MRLWSALCSAFALALLFATAALADVPAATTSGAPAKPRISAPDVDPVGGTFTESVHVVMVQNAQQAHIYYTLNNEAPNLNSTVYTAPFFIYNTGAVTLRAVAISDVAGRLDSVEVTCHYVIKAGAGRLPSIQPGPRTVRGSITVNIDTFDATVEYRTDLDDNFRPYREPFAITEPGHRTVYARRVVAGDANQPIVTQTYVVTPALRYDVSSNCPTCGFKPTRCQRFTVWLQGLTGGGKMFLTTSSRGCDDQTHMLDDTAMTTVDARFAAYHFRSAADPGSVYVCVREDVDAPYVMVPARGQPLSSTTVAAPFQLAAAPADLSCSTLPPTAPPTSAAPLAQYYEQTDAATSSSFLSIGNVIFWTLIIGVVAVVMRAHRVRMASNSDWQEGQRRPARTVSAS